MLFNYFRDFEDGAAISALGYDIIIRRRSIGALLLTSGKLVACDPLTSLDCDAFFQGFEPGSYPVHLFIAELRDEERAAYAMIKIAEGDAVRWEVANVHGPDESRRGLLEQDEEGYSVDSSIGCFMDADTALALIDYRQIVMPEEDELEKVVRAQVRKRRKRGPGWAVIELGRDLNLSYHDGELNLVAFDTGYGPGVYPTYIGRDADNQIVSVVTDFLVLDFRFPSFSFRGK